MAGKQLLDSGIQFLIMLVICSNCQSQSGGNTVQQTVDRNPAVSGQFYPGNKKALADTLTAMYLRATQKQAEKPVLAIIAPHAGYVFSGEIAASAYNQIAKKSYKNIFVIGSSHRILFDGAAIYSSGNFITPLGTAVVDCELGRKLIAEHTCFSDYSEAHSEEHSIEVQIPFLQHILGNELNLIPVILGTQTEKTCQIIADALKPYFTSENLFVISTDLSHYPNYSYAQMSDGVITEAITTNSPDNFLETLHELESRNIENLQTAMCGWSSVLTLLNITKGTPGITYKLIDLRNSGDSPFGDKSQVVGYAAIAVELDQPDDNTAMNNFLTPHEKEQLLQIARQTITEYLGNGKVPMVNLKEMTQGLMKTCGAFVTLTENGKLRGCIGDFTTTGPLYETIQDMAVSAATKDYRFESVTKEEIPNLSIEISVLTPMRKINSIDEIVLGRDGIYIKKDQSSGTFLPQVATETGWTKEEFLGHCARDKAGIGWNGWENAEIYIYQAIVFHEENPK